MSVVDQLTETNVVPLDGLTADECEAVHRVAFELFERGRATGVGQRIDGKYVQVFDIDGRAYAIGREKGRCYLFGPDRGLIAQGRQFTLVLEALEASL